MMMYLTDWIISVVFHEWMAAKHCLCRLD